ncbi:hypothetical protein GLP59_17080 [Sulfitobacter sp. M220]|uniref:hypothetical protein n=1 Tax=Sulfitobacter sp. M220 TaxID=2675333 RepID=UPI001F4389F0|nr:hypothetical protein [Sulfitobacter sp. M220]MCF7779322.1 hypothetical protein [Sulfitobacter sp. M220]
MAQVEQGMRFSHLYMSVGSPIKDSTKTRYRIAKLLEAEFPSQSLAQKRRHAPDHAKNAQDLLENEVGRQFRSNIGGRMYPSWAAYTQRVTVPEFLDTVTVIVGYLRSCEAKNETNFVKQAQRIFKEENMAYEVDDLGGIHPLVDAAFGTAKLSAIAALSSDRYSGTAELVEAIDPCLLKDPVDYIGAIRAVFGANENLFKLMFGVQQLKADYAAKYIGAKQQAMYEGHPNLKAASSKVLEGFKDWINAAHFYRHEQGEEMSIQPSEEFAILVVHQGLAYVRWLAQIDQKILSTPAKTIKAVAQ